MTRIYINGNEVTNPSTKFFLVLGIIVSTAMTLALVVFVLLPVIGVVVTLSLGLIGILLIAATVSVITLTLVSIIYSWFFGAAEFRFGKR